VVSHYQSLPHLCYDHAPSCLNPAFFYLSVANSPRFGQNSECYAQIIIISNDAANGVLQLSPTSLTVAEGVDVPPLRVVRTGGMFGEVGTLQLFIFLSLQWSIILTFRASYRSCPLL
jgi:hypothetical protein